MRVGSPTGTRVPKPGSVLDGHRYPMAPYRTRIARTDALARPESRQRALAIAVMVVITAGFLIRLLAADRLSPHVDEPSSILAAHAVADGGLPVLPSGTVYFQGATLSYLLLPYVWLGLAELEYLVMMRLVLVFAGTLAIYLSCRFGRYVTGDTRVGAFVAALVALDPVSVQWSGHVRMYALLQVLTIGLAWAFTHLLVHGASWRRCGLVVALCWAAVFTHAGAALLVLGMVLAATIICRRSLFRRWGLMSTLVLCGMAPATLIVLNQALGTASVGVQSEASGPIVTFVGDNLLAPLARFQVSPADWNWGAFIRPATLVWLVPGLTVVFSMVIGGRFLLRGYRSPVPNQARYAVVTLLSLYWVTVGTVGVLTVSPKERYLLHVHGLGYVFVAVVLIRLAGRRAGGRAGIASVLTRGLVIAVVMAIGAGLVWRLEERVVHPDYIAAMEYVSDRHKPGQPVIVALPAVGYLAMGQAAKPDLYFLAGSQDRPRAQRYTRWENGERLIDYWVGVDAIVTTDELSQFLLKHPDAWVVVDEDRLAADWAYAGAIERLFNDTTSTVFRAPGGALVIRPTPLQMP